MPSERSDASLPDDIARWFPAGVVERDGKIAGAWFCIDSDGERSRVVGVIVRADRSTGTLDASLTPEELDDAIAGLVAGGGHVGDRTFGSCIEIMTEFADGATDFDIGAVDALQVAHPDLSHGDVSLAHELWGREARDMVDRFLATLDPSALAVLREAKDDRLVDGYVGLDGTITPGAPLRVAIAAFPNLTEAIADAWVDDPAMFGPAGEPWPAEATVARILVTEGFPAPLAKHARPLQDAITATRADERPKGWLDPIQAHLGLLSRLPASWVPRGHAEWLAFVAMSDVASMAAELGLGDGDLPRFLNVAGRWGRWRTRIATASKGVSATSALAGTLDMGAAFIDQVMAPALAIETSREPEARSTGDRQGLGFRALFAGRSLASTLEFGAAWHGRLPLIDAALLSGDGGDATWPAGFPDMAHDGVDLVVLTSAADLVCEGYTGTGPDGLQGLSHCVRGYVARCLDGETRIASVRVADDVAGSRRLSTLELRPHVDTKGFFVNQHTGLANALPPRESLSIVARYTAALLNGKAVIDFDAFSPIPHGDATGPAGYGWRRPGRWEAVADAWRPVLPRHLRGLDRKGFASSWDGLARDAGTRRRS